MSASKKISSFVSTNRFKLDISSGASHALSTAFLEAAGDDDEDCLADFEACFVHTHKHLNDVAEDSFVPRCLLIGSMSVHWTTD